MNMNSSLNRTSLIVQIHFGEDAVFQFYSSGKERLRRLLWKLKFHLFYTVIFTGNLQRTPGLELRFIMWDPT